jgi:hypothetical protein
MLASAMRSGMSAWMTAGMMRSAVPAAVMGAAAKMSAASMSAAASRASRGNADRQGARKCQCHRCSVHGSTPAKTICHWTNVAAAAKKGLFAAGVSISIGQNVDRLRRCEQAGGLYRS